MKPQANSPTSLDAQNALITGLGEMPQTFAELAARMTPKVAVPTAGMRKAGEVPRFLALGALEDVYIPTNENITLALKIRRMIERGIMRRQMGPAYWQKHQAEAKALAAHHDAPPAGRSSAPTFAIVGTSGRGKTTALDMATCFYSLVPIVVGVHFAVPLLVLGVQGHLFSPNNTLPAPWNLLVGTAEIGIALSFLYGGLTRLFATLLGFLWVGAAAGLGWETALENLHYLGAAVFFYCAGRGPYSMDRMLFPSLDPSPALARHALPALRISIGVGFAFVAFTEKLANPALARLFLEQHPLNFTAAVGLPLSDDTFIWCAGATELLIGLFLAFGLFPRTIILVAWGVINLTLTLFSWVELVGHLPLYGIMSILLIWTPSEKTDRLWERGLLGHGRDGRG